jgi:hypothetical protein
MKPILCLLLGLLITAKASRGPTNAPQFSFIVQLDKNTFKPGEPIEALAMLHNQSKVDIYVPHAMTTCIGLEARTVFLLADRKGHAVRLHHGRGCGIGSGCGHCEPPSSFEEHVRTSWILLHPGEIFGARVDTMLDAPGLPGIYKIEAKYVPEQLVTGDTSGPPGNQVRVIAKPYAAAPVQITVAR